MAHERVRTELCRTRRQDPIPSLALPTEPVSRGLGRPFVSRFPEIQTPGVTGLVCGVEVDLDASAKHLRADIHLSHQEDDGGSERRPSSRGELTMTVVG